MKYPTNNIVHFYFLLIVNLLPVFLNAQVVQQSPNWGWPVSTETLANHRGRVVGTPGEYRTPYTGSGAIFGEPYPANQHRFHKGVDLTGDDGETGNVYSIEEGEYIIQLESSGYNRRARINETIYWHIVEEPFVENNETVISGNQHFAKMYNEAAHLHIQTPGTNYLLERLPGYQDHTPPELVSYSFRQNGHNLATNAPQLNTSVSIGADSYTLLYDKVDLVVRSRDDRVDENGNGTGGNIAPNRVGYLLFNSSGVALNTGIFNVDFTTLPTNYAASDVFGYGTNCCGAPVVFNYILTSHPFEQPYDRYWNTRLKAGLPEEQENNWTQNVLYNASVYEEALYKDDKYAVQFMVQDVDSDGILWGLQDTETANVYIDNFRPYIKEVSITLLGLPLYTARWNWDADYNNGAGNPPGKLVYELESLNNGWVADTPVTVQITASEPMNALFFTLNQDTYQYTAATFTENNTVAEITIPAAYLEALAGTIVLNIQGQDIAGNPLMGFLYNTDEYTAAQLPHRTGASTWSVPFDECVTN